MNLKNKNLKFLFLQDLKKPLKRWRHYTYRRSEVFHVDAFLLRCTVIYRLHWVTTQVVRLYL